MLFKDHCFIIFDYVKGCHKETIRLIICHIRRKSRSLGRNHRKKVLTSKIIQNILGSHVLGKVSVEEQTDFQGTIQIKDALILFFFQLAFIPAN